MVRLFGTFFASGYSAMANALASGARDSGFESQYPDGVKVRDSKGASRADGRRLACAAPRLESEREESQYPDGVKVRDSKGARENGKKNAWGQSHLHRRRLIG